MSNATVENVNCTSISRWQYCALFISLFPVPLLDGRGVLRHWVVLKVIWPLMMMMMMCLS